MLPEVTDGQLRAIEDAAGPRAAVSVVSAPAQARAAAPLAEVILGCVDAELFALAGSLRWIQATSSGVDFMLFPALRDSDVILTSEKGLVGPHLADHAMGLLLALTRQIAAAVRDGPDSWPRRREYRSREIELEGLALGIVGFGGTGRAIARRAAGFGMRVRAVDRDPVEGSAEVASVEPLAALPALLAASDVVALCAPLTPESSGMIDAAAFACMKPGAFLVNVTRGELVEHAALVDALASGHLGGAGLDVHHVEPLPADDPLWRFPNVVATPHTAGASQRRAARNVERFVENLRRFRAGDPLIGVVDKRLGY